MVSCSGATQRTRTRAAGMATRGDARPRALSGESPPFDQGTSVRRLGRGAFLAEPVHALANIRRVKNLIAFVAGAGRGIRRSGRPAASRKHGSTQQLIVDGKPFLILGGELGNSSATSADYMRPHWPRLKAMNLNTVLAPVSWELIEPNEGKFDWTSVDELLRDARAQDLKLVILWFGAWKNSMSTYVPSWVKRDQQRFPRAQLANGSSVEILSAFSTNTRDADVRAFGAFMEYLKRVDGDAEHRAHGAGGKRDRHVAHRARARRRGRQTIRRTRSRRAHACARRAWRQGGTGAARALAEEWPQSVGQLGAGVRRRRMRAPRFSPPGTTRASSRRSWSRARSATTFRCT